MLIINALTLSFSVTTGGVFSRAMFPGSKFVGLLAHTLSPPFRIQFAGNRLEAWRDGSCGDRRRIMRLG